MGYKTYKQGDSRWGSKNYNGSSSMSAAGCGPTSVACLAYAVDSSVTPWTVAKYMQKHGYAIRNNGTAWSGIPAAMKYYGLEDVQNVAKMDNVWKLLNKGYCAVFLMAAGSRGGICWTTGGHYIAVTDYKVKDGKHYVYTRDPGGRNHTGWYCYETQMRGLIPQIWCGYVPGMLKSATKSTTTTKKTTKKKTVKGVDVSAYQSSIDWNKVKNDGYTFAIIRAGYGKNNQDKCFKKHIEGAIKAGFDVMVYWFSYAYTKSMGTNEGKYCAKIIAPYKDHIKCVYHDFEGDSLRYARQQGKTMSKSTITAITKAFIEAVEKAGYKGGFYYNYDYKCNHYNMDDLKNYSHWYALYSSEIPECDLQQYSSSGKVAGISGNVDVNRLVDMTLPEKAADTTTSTTTTTSDWATKACEWAKKIAADDSYHYVKYSTDKATHECPVCHNHPKGDTRGWNCIGFAFAAWHHAGLKSNCSNDVIGDPTWNKILKASTDAEAEKLASNAVGIPVKVIRNGGKAVSESKIKKGDICAYFEGNSYKHTFLYIGNSKLADCTTGRTDEIKTNVAFSGNYKNKVKVVLRPKESTSSTSSSSSTSDLDMPSRGYFQVNDEGNDVKLVQELVNKAIAGSILPKLKVDGIYGAKTKKAVLLIQDVWHIKKDGKFGPNTLAKSKKKVTAIRKAINWAVSVSRDNSFAYGVGSRAHHGGCYFCGTNVTGPKKAAKGSKWEKTYCCNPFIFSAYAHGTGAKKLLTQCKKSNSHTGMDPKLWAKFNFDILGKCSSVKYADLKAGDVVMCKSHVWMFTGGGYLVEASGEGWGADTIAQKKCAKSRYEKYRKDSTAYVCRYNG